MKQQSIAVQWNDTRFTHPIHHRIQAERKRIKAEQAAKLHAAQQYNEALIDWQDIAQGRTPFGQ